MKRYMKCVEALYACSQNGFKNIYSLYVYYIVIYM